MIFIRNISTHEKGRVRRTKTPTNALDFYIDRINVTRLSMRGMKVSEEFYENHRKRFDEAERLGLIEVEGVPASKKKPAKEAEKESPKEEIKEVVPEVEEEADDGVPELPPEEKTDLEIAARDREPTLEVPLPKKKKSVKAPKKVARRKKKGAK